MSTVSQSGSCSTSPRQKPCHPNITIQVHVVPQAASLSRHHRTCRMQTGGVQECRSISPLTRAPTRNTRTPDECLLVRTEFGVVQPHVIVVGLPQVSNFLIEFASFHRPSLNRLTPGASIVSVYTSSFIQLLLQVLLSSHHSFGRGDHFVFETQECVLELGLWVGALVLGLDFRYRSHLRLSGCCQ